MIGSRSNDSNDIADLQTLLDRASISGPQDDTSRLLDEVTQNLKLRLNLQLDDDSIFESLAAQLLSARISGNQSSPKEETRCGVNSSHTSPSKDEPVIQNTWSTETTSTMNSPDSRGEQPTNSNINKGDSYANVTSRGRSPLRESKEEDANVSATTNTNSCTRGNNAPTSSGGMQKSGTKGRSPSPFRRFFVRKESREMKVDTSDKSAPGPTNTSPKPPMSPFPPTMESSLAAQTSSLPAARSDSPRRMSTSPVQAEGISRGSSAEKPPRSNSTGRSETRSPIPSEESNTRQCFRGRARSPSTMTPRARSKSCPRTASPSAFARRFPNLSPFAKTQEQQANIAEEKKAGDTEDSQMHDHAPANETVIPESSPLKTPLSHHGSSDNEFVTGKGKMRRKMAEEAVSPTALEVENAVDPPTNVNGFTSPVFNVNLTNPGKRAGKQRGCARKNKPTTRAAEVGGIANPSQEFTGGVASTPAPLQPSQAQDSEPALTPMDTEDTTPSFEGVSANSSFESQPVPDYSGVATVQFSIGDPGIKNGKRTSKRGPRARPTRTSYKQPQVPNATNPVADVTTNGAAPTSYEPGIDHGMVLQQINQYRENARKYYKEKDYRSSVNVYTDAIVMSRTLGRGIVAGDLLALLYSNRAAGLLMLKATRAGVEDCEEALKHVSTISSPTFTLATDAGPLLKAKLHIRMARSLLKEGKAERAGSEFKKAMQTAQETQVFCHRSHSGIELGKDGQMLTQIMADATLGETEVRNFKYVLDRIASHRIPSLRSGKAGIFDYDIADRKAFVAALGEVNTALCSAPACVDLHEKKIALLAHLRRWREVAGHCERFAASCVLCEGVFKKDLASKHPFPSIPPPKVLEANFFGDPYNEDFKESSIETAELKLNSKAAAEAALRLPSVLTQTYCRALRLEERYPAGDAAIKALQSYISSKQGTPEYAGLISEFSWLSHEGIKLSKTKKGRERGDELFRAGDFDLAGAQYKACLQYDTEGLGIGNLKTGDSGGRLHAVLHCNRAACLMALRQFDEAVRECTAALRIHPKYMKAMLRRGRCFTRLNRHEEAVNEYHKWLALAEEAKQEPSPAFLTPCLFDGPQKVTKDEIKQVHQELEEARKLKERKEKNAREEASYRHERQKFQDAFNDAQRRKEHWYNHQSSSSRRWDSFNNHGDGGGTKRSPNKKAHQHSYNQSDRRRPSQTGRDSQFSSSATHYGVLEIQHNATDADIKKAFRKLALKYHPDKNKDPKAAELFRRIKAAYEVLNDANSRRQYDQELRWGSTRF